MKPPKELAACTAAKSEVRMTKSECRLTNLEAETLRRRGVRAAIRKAGNGFSIRRAEYNPQINTDFRGQIFKVGYSSFFEHPLGN
jgi:hypothetical protein